MKAWYFLVVLCAFFSNAAAVFTNQTMHQIVEIANIENECVFDNTIILVVTNNITADYADHQIAPIRNKKCFSDRFVTATTDKIAMEKCVTRGFGFCVKTNFITYDDNFGMFALIGPLTLNNITVIYFAPTVVIFDIPYFTSEESTVDVVVQAREINGTGIDFNQSVFFPTDITQLFTNEFFLTTEKSLKLGFDNEETFKHLHFAQNATARIFEKDMWNTCWGSETQEKGIKYTINVACKNHNETLKYMKNIVNDFKNVKEEL